MTVSRIVLAGLSLGAVTSLSFGAQAASGLHVRPGLWEMKWSGESSGMPPVPTEYLARLPPEKRAIFEQRMKAAMASADKGETKKQCLTQEKLEHGFDLDKHETSEGCHRTVTANTGSVMEMKETCTGRRKMTVLVHFEAVNAQAIAGRVDINMSEGGRAMTMKRQVAGRWLGSDCGSVKPE